MKIQCSRCKALVDFTTYNLQHPDGRTLPGMVAVNQDGHYLCEVCMTSLQTHNPEQLGALPAAQFLAAQQIRRLSAMLVTAHDLLLRGIRNHGDPGGKFDAASAERAQWLSEAAAWAHQYDVLRGRTQEQEN